MSYTHHLHSPILTNQIKKMTPAKTNEMKPVPFKSYPSHLRFILQQKCFEIVRKNSKKILLLDFWRENSSIQIVIAPNVMEIYMKKLVKMKGIFEKLECKQSFTEFFMMFRKVETVLNSS